MRRSRNLCFAGPRGPAFFWLPVALAFVLTCTPSRGAQRTRGPGRVTDSILGVRLGARLEGVERRLDRLSGRSDKERSRESGGEREEEEEGGEGRRMAWSLPGTEFRSVAVAFDDEDRVVWITAFLRPGREIPFAKLGDLSIARVTDSSAVWNVGSRAGGYQLVARGGRGRASVVSLLSFASENEEVRRRD